MACNTNLAEAVSRLSVHDADALINTDIIGVIAAALAKSDTRQVSTTSAAAFNPAAFAAEQHARECSGAVELAAMLRVCKRWRLAICAVDFAWVPLLHKAYPHLDFTHDQRPHIGYMHLYQAIREVDRLYLEPPADLAPPHSPGASLSDFTFIIEVRFSGWSSTPTAADAEQQHAIGEREAWAGVLSADNLGSRPDSEAPCFSLLLLEGATCTLSVCVCAPCPATGGPPRTFEIYRDGMIEDGDEDCSEMYEYYTEKPLPYAHYGVGTNELDDWGAGLVPDSEVGQKFVMSPHVYTGSVALGLR
jgi:hypothetical protein